jgi:hypothetical protein
MLVGCCMGPIPSMVGLKPAWMGVLAVRLHQHAQRGFGLGLTESTAALG